MVPTAVDLNSEELAMLQQAIHELAKARKDLDEASVHVETLLDQLEQIPQYQAFTQAKLEKTAMRTFEREAYQTVSMLAINSADRLGTHPHPAVLLRKNRKVIYDVNKAIQWCLMRAPELVTMQLNESAFERLVLSNTVDTSDIASIEEYYKPAVSQDLSEYLKESDNG